MQRWTALLFLLAVLGLSAFTVHTIMRRGVGPVPAATSDAGVDGGADAESASDGGSESLSEGPAEPPSEDAGATLPSDDAGSKLGAEGPKAVVFGAILIQYRGREGARPGTRSRDAALALAKELAVLAKEDFKAAVAKGDPGSMENAGRMPRNMLERDPEYVLFSLPKGGVSDPIDTPRGFWIVHRIE